MDRNGHLMFFGWATSFDSLGPRALPWSMECPKYTPCELLPLPAPFRLVEVWCGSHLTVGADHKGGVWVYGSRGWSRASINDNNSNDEDDGDALSLAVLWEGALSCGESHFIALAKDDTLFTVS